jgi:hypothetical protein
MIEAPVFESFPPIPRLFRDMVVTEKIDGTNAAVVIGEDGGFACQSRKRFVTPDDDNYGFATWAYSMRNELTDFLGPGRHFGEWWGAGINRGYGLRERRFSLFNVHRWKREDIIAWPDGLDVVPTIYIGPFDLDDVRAFKALLQKDGSLAAPGYMNPEGVVVFHTAAQQLFKSTYEAYDLSGGKTWEA